MNQPPKTFACPRCGQPSTWHDNLFRPFCSERCKLVDLGAWANGDYKIPTQDSPSLNTPEYDQD
ncbi:DNA gyrase inhibitor YacG [Acinetobacter qingfengensis]|uniref:DNA gyrase inhibitor YacG n=1 Tax=Acinetobacter qingfengensis TaxID=1262585 RepID=A0A1E7R9Z6_9GAMM|nr:DNA gyrase inhibitor YacG [Acinetobacter qingfengensis]KAA8733915.1 DNA gyrase inhibitor YacG [Acinetobacter qingfengensis]OEY96166.1 DNA gyrase inhibitor YacG [Acinetobacter qingfengensis]